MRRLPTAVTTFFIVAVVGCGSGDGLDWTCHSDTQGVESLDEVRECIKDYHVQVSGFCTANATEPVRSLDTFCGIDQGGAWYLLEASAHIAVKKDGWRFSLRRRVGHGGFSAAENATCLKIKIDEAPTDNPPSCDDVGLRDGGLE